MHALTRSIDQSFHRTRVLFFVESVTLAHPARAVTLAQSLDPARYEVHLVCDPRYLGLFDELGFPVRPIRSIKSSVFQNRLANGDPLYTTADLREYVQEDLRVLTECEPDLVVGDFRLSLSISARLAGTPYVTVTNAHWSPYARPHFLVPEVPITERFGPRLAQALFNLIRPVVFAQHANALNKVRREYGFPAVGYDLAHMFSEADYTLYADLPLLIPTLNLPSHHHYIGPVVWSFAKRPYWWSSLRENTRTAYVTMGTSGRTSVAQMVADSLIGMGWQVLMATADDSTIARVKDQMYIANYLPGMVAARRADLVVCNGGSATVYQALAAGTPVLGIPMNLDQYLMMDYVRRFGAGEMIRAGVSTTELITRTVRRMVESPRYKIRAAQMREQIGHYRTGERFQTFVDGLMPNGKRITLLPNGGLE
ncbi:MAG: glycosyltransferase [Nitrospirales bacterium]